MQNKIRANVELTAQIVIAIAIVVVAGVLVKRQLFSSPTRSHAPQINAGEKLVIPNVDWEQKEPRLLSSKGLRVLRLSRSFLSATDSRCEQQERHARGHPSEFG